MQAYRAICRSEDLLPGKGRAVEVDGQPIALFRIGDAIYAIENVCLHAGAPLEDSEIEGTVITCPWHQWQFELKTGACMLHGTKLKTYKTREQNGTIEIELH